LSRAEAPQAAASPHHTPIPALARLHPGYGMAHTASPFIEIDRSSF
jgi:hypothetical protein